KSEGNFLRLQTLLDKGYDALDYRFFLLGGHYRKKIFFSYDAMDSAKNGRMSLVQKIVKIADKGKIALSAGKSYGKGEADLRAGLSENAVVHLDAFRSALENDLLMPVALSQLNKVLKDSAISPNEALELVDRMDSVLGLKLLETAANAQKDAANLKASLLPNHSDDPEALEIDALVAERTAAKKNKEYSKADEIRNCLKERGIIIIDTPDGSVWKRDSL
ncbi:MAG: CysS/YqeB C-terminal domain-containing protein, partial [Treponema sp.]